MPMCQALSKEADMDNEEKQRLTQTYVQRLQNEFSALRSSVNLLEQDLAVAMQLLQEQGQQVNQSPKNEVSEGSDSKSSKKKQ